MNSTHETALPCEDGPELTATFEAGTPEAGTLETGILEAAPHPTLSPDEIEAQRRASVISHLMMDDPDLTTVEANALYDQATREGA